MDAGQPDPSQINSMLTLMTTKEKQNEKGASVNINSNHTSLIKITEPSEKNSNEAKHPVGQKKPNINVTTNPLDISLVGGQQTSCNAQTPTGTTNRGRGRSAPGEKTDFTIFNEIYLSLRVRWLMQIQYYYEKYVTDKDIYQRSSFKVTFLILLYIYIYFFFLFFFFQVKYVTRRYYSDIKYLHCRYG